MSTLPSTYLQGQVALRDEVAHQRRERRLATAGRDGFARPVEDLPLRQGAAFELAHGRGHHPARYAAPFQPDPLARGLLEIAA